MRLIVLHASRWDYNWPAALIAAPGECPLDAETKDTSLENVTYGDARMDTVEQLTKQSLWVVMSAVALLFLGHAGSVLSDEVKVTLSGNQEIPPVTTSATGTGTLTVGADKSIRGGVTTSGIEVTAAHIHEAPAGKNGPIVVPMTKTSDGVWSIPADAKFTDAQYESYKAGNLYFNVHSVAVKSGEIRGQIKP